jgi:hypothetical protein
MGPGVVNWQRRLAFGLVTLDDPLDWTDVDQPAIAQKSRVLAKPARPDARLANHLTPQAIQHK